MKERRKKMIQKQLVYHKKLKKREGTKKKTGLENIYLQVYTYSNSEQ